MLTVIEDNTRNGILRTLGHFVYRSSLEVVSLARSLIVDFKQVSVRPAGIEVPEMKQLYGNR